MQFCPSHLLPAVGLTLPLIWRILESVGQPLRTIINLLDHLPLGSESWHIFFSFMLLVRYGVINRPGLVNDSNIKGGQEECS